MTVELHRCGIADFKAVLPFVRARQAYRAAGFVEREKFGLMSADLNPES